IGLLANDYRIGEIAAIAADGYRIVHDEHVAGHEDTISGRSSSSFRPGAYREIAVDDGRSAGRLNACRVDAAVNVQFCHPRPDVCSRPGVTRFRRSHALAK